MDPTIQFLFSAVFVLIGSLAFHISALVSGENIYRELSTQESTLLSIVVGIVIFLLSPISFIIFSSTDYIDVLTGILDFKVLLAFFGCAFGLGLIFGCVTILEARMSILDWFRDKSGMRFWIYGYGITWATFLRGVKRKGEVFVQTDNGIFKGLLAAFSIRDGQREIVLDKSKIKKYGIETDIEGEENEAVLIPGSEIKRIIVPKRSFKKHYESMEHISQAFYCIILAIGFFFLSYSAKLTGNYIQNLEIASLESFYGGFSPIFLALTIIVLGVSVWVAQKDFDNWRSFLVLSSPITFVALFFSLMAILLIIFNMKISQALILIFALAFISPFYIKSINLLGNLKEDWRAFFDWIEEVFNDWISFLRLFKDIAFAILFFSLLLIFMFLLIIFIAQKSQVDEVMNSFFPILLNQFDSFIEQTISLELIFIFVFSLLCIAIGNQLKKHINKCFRDIKKDVFKGNQKLLEEVINNFYLQLSCNDKDKARISAIKDEVLKKYENDEKKNKIENFIKKLDELKGYLFSTKLRLEDDLIKGSDSEELKYVFKSNGFPLPKNSIGVIKEDNKWVITDKERKKTHCIVWKEDGKLKIYNKDMEYLEKEDFNIIVAFKYFI
jgi:hypothetical protein